MGNFPRRGPAIHITAMALKPAEDVNGARAAGVEEAGAIAGFCWEVDTELVEPAAAPDPMGCEGKDEGGKNCGDGAAGGQAEAIGTRAPGKHGGKSDGEKLKNEREL